MVEFSPRVLALLEQSSPAESLDIVLELQPPDVIRGATRADAIERLRSDFHAASEPVRLAIEAAGGLVQSEAWINSTIRCQVPASGLKTLGERMEIVRIDLPRSLSPEG